MLSITSSKLSQRTPGDLSMPATDQQVLEPYKKILDWGLGTAKKWRQDWKQTKDQQYWEKQRNSLNGRCSKCRLFLAKDPNTGRRFCPSCKP